ncbi:MAG: hypothetical protein ACYDC6_04070 [Acidobacteriaceae bacterium]
MPKQTAKPLSPSAAIAQPAAVNLKDGQLTVNANNSDLTQILQHVADISGMTIDGLSKSTRVFGVYGPGNPSDVLTALLVGTGYNFLLVGNTSDGAPSKLLLIAQNDNVPALPPANGPPAASDTARDNAQQSASELHQSDSRASTPSVAGTGASASNAPAPSAAAPDASDPNAPAPSPPAPDALPPPPQAASDGSQNNSSNGMQQTMERLQQLQQLQQQSSPQ